MNLAWWLNTAWMLSCRPEAARFRRATHDVADTQAKILQTLLHRNRKTDFGTKYGFDSLRSPQEFQRKVPLSGADDYREPIARIARGEKRVLTAEPVELLEPTSGTTTAEKWIPYTASLRREFQRALAAWIADLTGSRPAVRAGRAYWSISPALGRRDRTEGGITVGFDDDAAYLGNWERLAVRHLLVAPPTLSQVREIEAFRYATLWALLSAADLALISVWNPTFLTILMRRMETWSDRLAKDLTDGELRIPQCESHSVAAVAAWCRLPRRRGREAADILQSDAPLARKVTELWPRLALISCWADGAAALPLPELQSMFPHVEIQPKGLLATEGCVTFPLVGRAAPVLAVRSHFFEFEPLGGPEPTRPLLMAHELNSGETYRVVMTTGGGLYRYQLRDEVECVGFENQCPLLRFRGKSDRVSDLVGEKLSEAQVRAAIDAAFADRPPQFALLAPCVERQPMRYLLFCEWAERAPTSDTLEAARTVLQRTLERNPHYEYAVKWGQLAPVEIRVLDGRRKSGWQIFEERCLARGQKLGDVKPTALDSEFGWSGRFQE